MSVRRTLGVGAFVLALGSAGSAVAQTAPPEATVSAPAPAPRNPSAEAVPRLDEQTALTVGKNRLKLGVLSFEYGITEHLSVGTSPPVWAVRAFKPVFVPNLGAKYQFVARDPLWVAATAAVYFGDISNGQAAGQVLDIPLSLFASFKANRHLYLHGEGTYLFIRGFGGGDLNRADIGGTLAARAVQAQLMAEIRVVRWFAFTALGRYQIYTGSLNISGSGNSDPFTTVSVDAELSPRVQHPWEAVGGIALLFEHVHVTLGAGYGYYFVPGLEIPLQRRTVVPAGDLSFLFTL